MMFWLEAGRRLLPGLSTNRESKAVEIQVLRATGQRSYLYPIWSSTAHDDNTDMESMRAEPPEILFEEPSGKWV